MKSHVQFYIHAQHAALKTFLPILVPHLPTSNPLYNRLQAPQNTPSRQCLFAATFPPNTSPIPEVYSILFADRSRHLESQIWIFNPLQAQPVTVSSTAILNEHAIATIAFLKDIQIPEAPGWPFSPVLRFSCLHETIASAFLSIGRARDAIPRCTLWNLWQVKTSDVSREDSHPLPEGFKLARVPDDQMDIVVATSSIPRQPTTLKMLPSVGLLNEDGKMVAWGFIGIDASFATLYVLPEYRGKGFAKTVAAELIGRLDKGDFTTIGFDGSSGWVHSDVYEGNEGSESVMRFLGGTIGHRSYYFWIDTEKF